MLSVHYFYQGVDVYKFYHVANIHAFAAHALFIYHVKISQQRSLCWCPQDTLNFEIEKCELKILGQKVFSAAELKKTSPKRKDIYRAKEVCPSFTKPMFHVFVYTRNESLSCTDAYIFQLIHLIFLYSCVMYNTLYLCPFVCLMPAFP